MEISLSVSKTYRPNKSHLRAVSDTSRLSPLVLFSLLSRKATVVFFYKVTSDTHFFLIHHSKKEGHHAVAMRFLPLPQSFRFIKSSRMRMPSKSLPVKINVVDGILEGDLDLLPHRGGGGLGGGGHTAGGGSDGRGGGGRCGLVLFEGRSDAEVKDVSKRKQKHAKGSQDNSRPIAFALKSPPRSVCNLTYQNNIPRSDGNASARRT